MIIDLDRKYFYEEIKKLCSHYRSSKYTVVENDDRRSVRVKCLACQFCIELDRALGKIPYEIYSVSFFYRTDKQLDLFYGGDLYYKNKLIPLTIKQIDLENYKDKLSKILVLI